MAISKFLHPIVTPGQASSVGRSAHDGQNIGYPGEPTEIDWFLQMIQKAAPKISEQDVKVIETALRHAKKA